MPVRQNRAGEVGLLLSGPLGLEAAKGLPSLVGKNGAPELAVAVGSTPALAIDYQKKISDEVGAGGFRITSWQNLQDHADTLICVGWRMLIPLRGESQKVFVFHDSLLPKLRGWNPLVTAIETQETQAGVSLIFASEELDAGPVVSQYPFELTNQDTIRSAINKAGVALRAILQELMIKLQDETLTSRVQNHDIATYSLWRDNCDYQIDWARSAEDIEAFIRSRSWPYLGAVTNLGDLELRVLDSSVIANPALIVNPSPGKVFSLDGGIPTVVCGKGQLRLEKVVDSGGSHLNIRSIRSRFH